MLRNLDTIYYIARSSKNFSTEINFSENIFFGLQRMVAENNDDDSTVMVIYDSGANRHYISEQDRKSRNIDTQDICQESRGGKLGHAQRTICHCAPISTSIQKGSRGRHIQWFPNFTHERRENSWQWQHIYFHQGRSFCRQRRRRPLQRRRHPHNMQGWGNSHWQTRREWQISDTACKKSRQLAPKWPTTHSKKYFQQANSMYNLPSTKEAIKWMHAVCGFLVKSTWLKAVKAGN